MLKEEIKNTLIEVGYDGDFSLSNVIDWIRINKHFNIWIEHGHTPKKTRIIAHDVVTKFGCHRGMHETYEIAQIKGIEIFLKLELNKI